MYLGSVKPKFHFDTNLHIDWSTVFQGRIEAPLLHGLHGLGVQAEAQSVDDSNVTRMSGCVDNQPESARALSFRLAGFFRVLRVGSRKWLR